MNSIYVNLLIQSLVCLLLSFLLYFYYAKKNLSFYVIFLTILILFLVLENLALLPFDVYIYATNQQSSSVKKTLKIMYVVIYWSTFFLTWVATPIIKEYELSGYIIPNEKMKDSIKSNVKFYILVGIIGIIVLFIIVILKVVYSDDGLKKIPIDLYKGIIDVSNLYGLAIVIFFLGYSFAEIPSKLFRKTQLRERVRYLERVTGKLSNNLKPKINELLKYAKQIESTIFFIRRGINNYNEDQKQKDEMDKLNKYIKYLEKIIKDFRENKDLYQIDLDATANEEDAIVNENKLIQANIKLTNLKSEVSYAVKKIDSYYKEWVVKKSILYSQNYTKINDHITYKIDINEGESSDSNNCLIKEYNYQLINVSKFQIFYYSKIRPIIGLIEILFVIFFELLLIVCELSLLFSTISENRKKNRNYCFLCKLIDKKKKSLSYVIILIPLIFYFLMAGYTLLKIKIKGYICIHGRKKTDGASLMTLCNFMCTIVFAVCLHFNDILSQYHKTVLFQYYKFDIDNKTIRLIYHCFPLILIILIALNYFNVLRKLKVFGNQGKDLNREELINDGEFYLKEMHGKMAKKNFNKNNKVENIYTNNRDNNSQILSKNDLDHLSD